MSENRLFKSFLDDAPPKPPKPPIRPLALYKLVWDRVDRQRKAKKALYKSRGNFGI